MTTDRKVLFREGVFHLQSLLIMATGMVAGCVELGLWRLKLRASPVTWMNRICDRADRREEEHQPSCVADY